MDQELQKIYNQYIELGNTETPEQFLEAKDQMGDQAFFNFINSQIDLKKKDDTQVTPENLSTVENGINTEVYNPVIPETVSEQFQGIPMNQIDPRFDQTLMQPIQPIQDSLESDSILPVNFTVSESILPITNNKSFEKTIPKNKNSFEFLAGKPDENDVLYTETLFDNQSQEELAKKSKEDANFNEFLLKYADKGYFNPDIQPAPFNTVIISTEPNIEKGNKYIIELEKSGVVNIERNPDGTLQLQDGKVRFRITDKNYYDSTYLPYIAELNNIAVDQNEDSARFNYGNMDNPLPVSERDQYANELQKEYGFLLNNDQRRLLYSEESRKNLETTLEVEKRLKENPSLDYNTVLNQVTAEKKGITPQQKEAIGTGYIQKMLIGGDGVFDTLHTEDTQDELKFYQDYFRNPENRKDFGEFMNDEGKAVYDTSWMRRNNTAKRQEKRKELFESFIAWKGKQSRLDYAFSEEAFRDAEARAEGFRKTNNIEGLQNEINEMKKYEAQMRASNATLETKKRDFDNAQQYYSKTNQEKKIKEDFQMRVQNDEFGANAENFIGNILLGAETSVQNAATGLLRIAATPFGKGNVNDAIDIMSEPISVGKVDIARISDEVVTYSQGNNTYREINGRLYQVAKDGKIFRPDIIPDKESLTEVSRERDINVSGLAFVTSKMISDIYITQRVGGGINGRIANFANSVNNSKRIASVFGEGSQIANQAANLSRVMKGANSNMITGWTVQQYNDNYLAAKNGGIENETNRHLYAFATSFLLAQIQRINPDTNFLKSINSEYKSVVSSLLENNSQKALIAVESFVKKAAKNTAGETAEELVQQGTQDLVNMFVNTVGNKELRVSTENDYKDVVVGTIVPSIIASAFGGNASRVNIEGRSIDLTSMTRNELVTELARTERGIELLKDFRENTYFESLQNESDKLVAEVQERKKYINKIPDSENYTTEQINNAIPLLQEIENLKREKQKDDGTFAEKLDNKISDLRNQVNTILNNDSNENPQSEPQPEAVQEQATTVQSESEQTSTSTNTESSINEIQNNNTESEQAAVIQDPNILSNVKTQQNETAQNNTDISEPADTETPVQPINQTNDNFKDSTTTQSENTQSPQAEISTKIFNDSIDLANLNEEQISETERQIESAAALFASFNEPGATAIQQIEKSRISSNGKYNIVEKTDNIGNKNFELFDVNDKPIQISSKQKNVYIAEYINAQEYPETEIDISEGINEKDLYLEIISKSENPKEIAQIILFTPRFDSTSVAGSKDWAISQVLRGNNVNRNSFIENDDKNNITNGIARTYFAKNNGGKSIDNLAQEASEQFTSDYNSDSVTIQDVIDFIKKFPNDPTKAERPNNPLYDSAVEKFIKLTGQNPTKNLLNRLISNNENNDLYVKNLESEYDNIISKEQNNLINQYNNWFNSLSLEQKISELENTIYENNSKGNTQQENIGNENKSAPNRQGERNQDATDKIEIQKQQTETQFARITQEAFNALIERLKKPFSKAFSNINVTSDWNEFQEKAKTLGLKDDQIQRLQSNFSYRMDHSAPTRDNGDNALYDLIDVYGEDIYGSNALKYFGEGDLKIDKESISVIQSIRDNPDAEITIYRAVPKNVSDINTGDWVSISRQYAVNHGEIWLKGDYSILEKKVKASQVFTDGNSISEQGVQFMQNANGTVYGAKLPDGTIYINPENLNANTPIHEFSHLWEQVMPNAWKRGLEIFKQTNTGKRLFEQIKSEGNYASLSDDMIWSEALNTHIGNYGEWRNSNPRSKMKEFADWLKNIFTRLGNAFGIKTNPETSLKQFTEGVVGDLLGGKEISTEVNPALSSNVQFSIVSKKPMPNSTFAAVVNATSSGGKEAGYNALAESAWYKSLSENQQSQITVDNFQNTMLDQAQIYREKIQEKKNKAVAKVREAKNNEIKDIKKTFRDKISELKKDYNDVKKKLDKITNAKQRLSEKIYWRKQASNAIKLLLNDKFIRDKVTPYEIKTLITLSDKIINARNIDNAFDEFQNKLYSIIDKAEARANKKDEWEEFKNNPEALKADPNVNYQPLNKRNIFRIFKEKWFANQGGLMKPFIGLKDNAKGSISWEMRIAKNIILKLKKEQYKLNFTTEENDKQINDALRGDFDAYNTLPENIQLLVTQMRNQIDGLSEYLIVNNLVTSEQAATINENMGSYLTRGYDYFEGKTGDLRTVERNTKKVFRILFKKEGTIKSEFDSEKWFDAVTVFQQNILNDIAADKKLGDKSKYGEDFHNQTESDIQSYARTMGESKLTEYIESLEQDYQKQGSQQKADTSVLERKKDVPEPIRKLLGEYEDPKISFALTVSRMSQLAYQRKFMSQLKDMGMGTLFFKENDPNKPPTHYVKIASDSNDAYSPLNGLYTTPEFKDVFLDITEQNINDIGRLWMKATGYVKVGKTVLSPVTQMVNFFANPGFLINNGTILDVKNLGAAVNVFIDDMKGAKSENPILQELVEENIIDQNIVFNELESDFGYNIEKDLMRNIRQNTAVKTARDVLSIPFRAYKASDDFFKAFTYYAEANRYSKSIYGKKYKDLKGDDRLRIRKIASEVTKNTMPNYDRRYKAADYVRMKTGNLFGNFLSFQAESVRTKINSVQIAIADIKNPDTRSVGIQRMAGIMTYNAIYATVTSYLGSITGMGLTGLLGFFDDDDEDKKNKSLNRIVPSWARSTEKFVRKEKDGTITFYTYGNSNPYGIWYKTMNAYQNGSGNYDEGGIISVIDEFTNPFFGTEMSAQWAVNTFVKEENDWGADLVTWEDKVRYSWEKLAPTAFKVYKDNMDNNDKNNFDIYNALGIKKYNFSPTEQLSFKFRDWQTKVNDIGKKKYNLQLQYKNGKITESDFKSRSKEYEQEQIEITDQFKKTYESFLKWGADPTKLLEKGLRGYEYKFNSAKDFIIYLNINSSSTEKMDAEKKSQIINSSK